MKIIFSFFLVLFFNTSNAQLGLNWKHRLSKNDIEVFTSETPNSDFKGTMAHTTFDAHYLELLNFLLSPQKHLKFIPNCSKSVLLKNINDTSYTFYQQFDMPWPVQDRDIIFEFRVRRDSLKQGFIVNTNGLPNYMAKDKNFIRVPYFKAKWKVDYAGKQKVKSSYAVHANPGGMIQAWFINLFIVESPYTSFYKMKKYFLQNAN